MSDLPEGIRASAAGSCASLSPSSRAVGDRRWKQRTKQANRAYAQGDMALALAAYTDALTEAQRLFDCADTDHDMASVPVIFNISCHNLAELFERSGDMSKAEACYQMACDRLLAAARSASEPLALRIGCAQHLRHALAMLVQHLHRHGAGDDRIGAIVSAAHHAVYCVYQLARHAEQAAGGCAHRSLILS